MLKESQKRALSCHDLDYCCSDAIRLAITIIGIPRQATKYAWRAASAEASLVPAQDRLARTRRQKKQCEDELVEPETNLRKV